MGLRGDRQGGGVDRPGGGALVTDSDPSSALTFKRKVKTTDHHGNELEDQNEVMMTDGQAPPLMAPPPFSAPHSQTGRASAGRNREWRPEITWP